jgi:hypothetical protein
MKKTMFNTFKVITDCEHLACFHAKKMRLLGSKLKKKKDKAYQK